VAPEEREEAKEELEDLGAKAVLAAQVALVVKVVLGVLVLAQEECWRNQRSHCTLS